VAAENLPNSTTRRFASICLCIDRIRCHDETLCWDQMIPSKGC
jgi:hypothetical protein